MDGKAGQDDCGQTAIKQKGGLHEAADARLATVETPNLIEPGQMFLAPFNQRNILVDNELDAIGHGFQPGQRHHAFHGSGDDMINGVSQCGSFAA